VTFGRLKVSIAYAMTSFAVTFGRLKVSPKTIIEYGRQEATNW